jgi:hypothetical protein
MASHRTGRSALNTTTCSWFSVVNPIVAGALNRINQDVDMVTLRVNYRFGGYGAPVAARY